MEWSLKRPATPTSDPARPKLPVEAFRDFYLTEFGGFSADLSQGEIGISARALATNTRLRDYARVLVTRLRSIRRIPFTFRLVFEVVALDSTRPAALAQSPEGEAVLGPWDASKGDWLEHAELCEGDEIVLNSAVDRFEIPENLLRRVAAAG